MFGLPITTTLIMAGVMTFWIVYTLVFYFSTSRWSVEDEDYGEPGQARDDAAPGRSNGAGAGS